MTAHRLSKRPAWLAKKQNAARKKRGREPVTAASQGKALIDSLRRMKMPRFDEIAAAERARRGARG